MRQPPPMLDRQLFRDTLKNHPGPLTLTVHPSYLVAGQMLINAEGAKEQVQVAHSRDVERGTFQLRPTTPEQP